MMEKKKPAELSGAERSVPNHQTDIIALIYRALKVEQDPGDGYRVAMLTSDQMVTAFGDLIISAVTLAIMMGHTPESYAGLIAGAWHLGEIMAKKLDGGSTAIHQEEGHA